MFLKVFFRALQHPHISKIRISPFRIQQLAPPAPCGQKSRWLTGRGG